MVSNPNDVAVNTSVASPFDWIWFWPLESVPWTGVSGKIEPVAGSPINTLRSLAGIGLLLLSCKKLAVTVELSPTRIGLGLAVLLWVIYGEKQTSPAGGAPPVPEQ